MDLRRVLQDAMDRKNLNCKQLDDLCGFKRYTESLLNPKRGGPEKAELGRIQILAEKLGCPELLTLRLGQESVLKWDRFRSDESAISEYSIDMSKIRHWLSLSRCIVPFLTPEPMRKWYNQLVYGPRSWTLQKLEEYHRQRKEYHDKRRKVHADGDFVHEIMQPESLYRLAAKENHQWIRQIADSLESEFRKTVRLALIPDEHWPHFIQRIDQGIQLYKPCIVQVADVGLANYVSVCGEGKLSTQARKTVDKFWDVLNGLSRLIPNDTASAAATLRKIAGLAGRT